MQETMSMQEWAKQEIALAIKSETAACEGIGFDYGKACYESALKAFEALCEDGHSGSSIRITQSILNRLIDGKALTPIKDTDDIWYDVTSFGAKEDTKKTYQCKRTTSLFKYVQKNGTVSYNDIDRSKCVNINDSSDTYHFGFVEKILDELKPITMPYTPPSKPIEIYVESLSLNLDGSDIDLVGVFYAEDGDEKIEINRFFKQPTNSLVPISKIEYDQIKIKAQL